MFDDTITARVLDVMICGREYDYALTDLSRTTGTNRQRLAKVLQELAKRQIIYPTRKLAGMQMYKLSGTHPAAKALADLYDTLVKVEVPDAKRK